MLKSFGSPDQYFYQNVRFFMSTFKKISQKQVKVERGFMGKKCPNGKVILVNKFFLAVTPILTPKKLFKVSLLRRPIRDFALYFSHHLAGCQIFFFCLKIDVLSKKLCKIKIGSMVNKTLSRHRITELFFVHHNGVILIVSSFFETTFTFKLFFWENLETQFPEK